MLLKLAWRNLWRNRKRTTITASSIVFAVFLAILLNSVKEGMLQRMQENMVNFYSGGIQIHQKGYWDDQTINNTFDRDSSMEHKLRSLEAIREAVPRLESFALTASGQHSRGCLIVGIDPQKEQLITKVDERLVQGRFLQPGSTEVLITSGLASYLKLRVGDTLVILGQGYHGATAAGKYPIVGMLEFASPQLNKNLVYLPLSEAQWLFAAPDKLSALVLHIGDINQAEPLAASLQTRVGGEYEVMPWSTLLPELDQLIEGERAENVIFLFVLYLLISFGIFGTILMMTMERRFEFGVLIAIGMKKRLLAATVMTESVMISLTGALVGVLISLPVIAWLNAAPIQVTGELREAYLRYGFEPVFYFSAVPGIFYSQVIVVMAIALVLALYPMLKISRLDPVSAMRA